MEELNIGDRVKIINMVNEPEYAGREGIVVHIDDLNQVHGTWGGCAIVPEIDEYIVLGNVLVDSKLDTN